MNFGRFAPAFSKATVFFSNFYVARQSLVFTNSLLTP